MEERSGFHADRLRGAEWFLGAAALALLLDLLILPWYSLRASFVATSAQFGAATSATGLQAHHVLGPLVLLLGLCGLLCWGLQATRRAPALPACATVLTAMLALGISIALLIRVVFDPPSVLLHGAPGVVTDRTDVGAVLGVFLSWFVFLGAWISQRTDGIVAADAPARVETLRLSQRPA